MDEELFAQYRECTDKLYEQGEVNKGGAHDRKAELGWSAGRKVTCLYSVSCVDQAIIASGNVR